MGNGDQSNGGLPKQPDPTPQPPPTQNPKSPIIGVDVSHWQGQVDFAGLKSQGYQFCFAKATEGASIVDDQFLRNKTEAFKNGFEFGAYHFFHPGQNPIEQANQFIATVGSQSGMLPPVLDWEVSDGVRASVQISNSLMWLNAVEKAFGKIPLIYGSPSFLSSLGLPESFTRYPLWVANYGVNSPHIPSPWLTNLFWQYSSDGGIDKDQFPGTFDTLRSLAS